MQKLVVKGKKSLSGIVKVSGSKNATLPILAASILNDKKIEIKNVPIVKDVLTMSELLKHIGSNIKINTNKKKILINNKNKKFKTIAPYAFVKTMRAGVIVLGSLLSKFGKAKVSLPGGCAIGSRPVDIHLFGLKKLGADIKIKNGYILASAKKGLTGATIRFPSISVGATENVIIAASFAKGTTYLKNCACEPEIKNLTDFLKKELAILKGMGVELKIKKNEVQVLESKNIKPVKIKTEPYPGFPTDLQAQIMVLMIKANGKSKIKENIFENRFMHVPELNRMGAKIKIYGNTSIIHGSQSLYGAEVMATDLRASVSLVLAGLIAKDKTIINRVYHLDRGYEGLEKKLRNCKASISRIHY